MKRRGFLRALGIGTAVAVAAPLMFEGSIAGEGIIPADELWAGASGPVTPGPFLEYADYTNFSQFVIASSFDEIVSKAAADLGRAAAEEVSRQCRTS